MSDALTAGTITIGGHGGDQIEAYLARPEGQGPRGGVVVIHHLPGYDRATKEIVRRFAEM
jgi:carboxymethylenebutenolidase